MWSNHLSNILGNHLGVQSSLDYPSVWFNAETDDARNEYYTYSIVYVDDLLIVYKKPRHYMDMLDSKYTVKPSNIGYPTV